MLVTMKTSCSEVFHAVFSAIHLGFLVLNRGSCLAFWGKRSAAINALTVLRLDQTIKNTVFIAIVQFAPALSETLR